METLWLLLTGGALVLTAQWGHTIWHRRQVMARRDNSADLFQKHGLRAELYNPAGGIDDPALAEALSAYSDTGYIVLGSQGQVVGQLVPTAGRLTQTRPRLKLVVSNDN